MTHKLIHAPNYLLVVDDSEIKEGNKSLLNIEGFVPMILTHHEPIEEGYEGKKIIAHLPLNDSPILTGVDLLPSLEQEDDVEGLAKTQWGNVHRTGVLGYIDGYNKAKEKYKYTEEDVKITIQQAFLSGVERLEDFEKVEKMILENIQSLSQPKMPVGFECEESVFFATNAFSSDTTLTSEGLQDTVLKGIKTTTNSQGQIVWVGKYIY